MPSLATSYHSVRQQTLRLTENLTAEDMTVQSMPDASPTKWHLAHTTWFFEEFILRAYDEAYQSYDDNFSFLFNSYYEAVGDRHPRPDRGLLSRPGLPAVLQYRAHVDSRMQSLLEAVVESTDPADSALHKLVVTGLHHEMQHQELLLTDILHLLSFNPLCPAVCAPSSETAAVEPLVLNPHQGGLVEVGAADEGFSYDCERPRHSVFLPAYRMASRLVTNGEWLAFIEDGGYENPMLWLADGWDLSQRKGWRTPLYWRQFDGEWYQFGLDGLQALNLAAPVCHISYYEADAYAQWAGKRLPSEQEWEHGVLGMPVEGNFLESAAWRPQPTIGGKGLSQVYGDVWEWTRSPYMAYPGFEPEAGQLQEYNGKFMANQFVLKGGSCVSSKQQLRPSYRNFFFPHQRWQFTGLRLAEDH